MLRGFGVFAETHGLPQGCWYLSSLPSPPQGLPWLRVNTALFPTDARRTATESNPPLLRSIGGEEGRDPLSQETREAKESWEQHRDRELSPPLLILPSTMPPLLNHRAASRGTISSSACWQAHSVVLNLHQGQGYFTLKAARVENSKNIFGLYWDTLLENRKSYLAKSNTAFGFLLGYKGFPATIFCVIKWCLIARQCAGVWPCESTSELVIKSKPINNVA